MTRRGLSLTEWMQRDQLATRRRMLRDLDAMSRRELLRRGGTVAAGATVASTLFSAGIPLIASARQATPAAAVALPEYGEIPANLKGTGEVRVISWGGTFQDAQRLAYFEPFERLTGIKVIEAEGPDASKIKAGVDTGNVEYDVAELDRSDVLRLTPEENYWEPIDYSFFDVDNIAENFRYKYSIDMLPYATVIGYRTDVFAEGPTGQKDFWDTAAFPGPRTTEGGTGGVFPFLEAALMADGVAKEALYPLDIERAFASLSRIRGDVVTFWEAGAQPAQLLNDNEVVMAHSWNGRMHALQEANAPVNVVWNEAQLATDVWAVPKGAANAENAMKFAAFITLPVSQARLCTLIPYGFVNVKAADYLTPDQIANLPTSPEYLEKMTIRDIAWWVANTQAVQDRWNEWILE